jgi:type II secretory pathway pseudopilin PulG
VELLFVLAILGVCLAVGALGIGDALRAREAKGAAQSWQAAAAWAQAGVLWHGGSSRLVYGPEAIAVAHTERLCGGDVGGVGPSVAIETNVSRWRVAGGGSVVTFGGSLGSPDGGGSLYFGDGGSLRYRVVVRPESGLTTRAMLEPAP